MRPTFETAPERTRLAGTALLPGGRLREALVEVEDGRIVSLVADPPRAQVRAVGGALDARGAASIRLARDEVLAPAFIDVHCHGAGGGDVLGGGLDAMARTLLRHGVGAVVATIATAPIGTLMGAARDLARARDLGRVREPGPARELGPVGPGGGEPPRSAAGSSLGRQAAAPSDGRQAAAVLGLHLEGPALAPARSAGHDPAAFASPAELSASLAGADSGWSHVRIVTLAPELEGGLELVRQLADAGFVVSIGHTDTSLAVGLAAYEAGARSATHLLNGMPPLLAREPGPVGAALAAAPFVELISDGVHIDGALLAPLARAIGEARLLLVSDALPLAGSRLRRVATPGSSARIVGDRALHPDGTLAGSRLLLDGMLAGAVRFGMPVETGLRAVTENPARLLGLTDRGILEPGRRADLVVVSRSGVLRRVLVAGGAGGR
jgi:N-acetylglucosamine-6-phosphate deacetylase